MAIQGTDIRYRYKMIQDIEKRKICKIQIQETDTRYRCRYKIQIQNTLVNNDQCILVLDSRATLGRLKASYAEQCLMLSLGQWANLGSSLGRTLNLLYYPPTTTANFLKGSKHSRRPRFGMLASHRLMNYTIKLVANHHPQDGHTPSKD